MYCYNVIDGIVVRRTYRKRKLKCTDDVKRLVQELVPDANVMCLTEEHKDDSLFAATCGLAELSEDAVENEWFVSYDNSNVLALALLSVIEKESAWKVLQDETVFDEWIKRKVR